MGFQLDHDSITNTTQHKEIILLCDNLTSPANVGGVFRLCEGFGINKVIFSNSKIDFNSSRLKRTARNTISSTPYTLVDDPIEIIKTYRQHRFQIIALEITSESIPLENFRADVNHKILLIIGNERYGVSKKLLSITDNHLHINMFGENSSLNVTHATAIAFYHFTKNFV